MKEESYEGAEHKRVTDFRIVPTAVSWPNFIAAMVSSSRSASFARTIHAQSVASDIGRGVDH
jgi:hypothetical protein